MAGLLENQVALITGGSSGIGRASALVFAEEGAKVVVAARRVAEGEETARLVRAAGGDAAFVRADVSKNGDVEAMVRFAVETYGRLDCAFNNAGVEKDSLRIVDFPQEDWDEVIAINLTGVWLCMKHEIRQMLAQGAGAIVNNSSTDGLVGDANVNAAYVASKHGVVGLTKSVGLEYARQNIRVNAVCPGWVRTPMVTDGVTEAQVQATVEREEPVGRIGEPEEVARAAAWLCSDAASFITGAALPVDGGVVAR